MRSGPDLYAWLAALPPDQRDAAAERALGIDAGVSSAPPGEHLVGHHMLGVAALVRALHAVPVRTDDVVVDLGAGLGKLVSLTERLTGARARGIEIQQELVDRAVGNVKHGDARAASLDDATVVLLYCPFDGPVLDEVSRRLDALDVVVCAFGVDLRCTRLLPRPSDDFWMTIWDAGAPRAPAPMSALAQAVAHGRTLIP